MRPFVDMGAPVKTQVENGLSKLFDFRDQTIDVYDQAVFTLKDSGLHDEEGNKINKATLSQHPRGDQVVFCLS